AELIIAKNRHGAIGTVNLTFRKDIARFESFTSLAVPHTSGLSSGAPSGIDS
ncbi:MAG: hypothetical protein HY324_01570, partial [Chlamydiia bacterium]|nr:hypothetical protein [Chlamydiia bacterium]